MVDPHIPEAGAQAPVKPKTASPGRKPKARRKPQNRDTRNAFLLAVAIILALANLMLFIKLGIYR